MRYTDLERAENEVQLRMKTRAVLGIELVKLRAAVELTEGQYHEADEAYRLAEAKAEALRPAGVAVVRTRLSVLP